MVLLEPDSLADLPSDCGYDPAQVNIQQATADRYTPMGYAISKLTAGQQTLVYIDAGNSHWQAVPTIATRLVQAGIQNALGFFTNVSNFNLNNYETKYDTWVSSCLALGSVIQRVMAVRENTLIAPANTTRPLALLIQTISPLGDIRTNGISRIWEQP